MRKSQQHSALWCAHRWSTTNIGGTIIWRSHSNHATIPVEMTICHIMVLVRTARLALSRVVSVWLGLQNTNGIEPDSLERWSVQVEPNKLVPQGRDQVAKLRQTITTGTDTSTDALLQNRPLRTRGGRVATVQK